VIGAAQPLGQNVAERRMRRRRAVKIILTVAFAIIWVPIAIVMIVVSSSDRLR
jgi:hypothetical protein